MNHEVADTQSKAIENKASYWRQYLRYLFDDIHNNSDYYLLKSCSLWSSTFAYIEWLIVFHQYQSKPSLDYVAETLSEAWGWNQELCKVFWCAGRNPMAHVGQSNTFYSYRIYNSLKTNVLFENNIWSNAVTDEWGKYHQYRAVTILPTLDMGEGEVQHISVSYQMLLDELLPKIADYVVLKIQNETDPVQLLKITKLNKQILH
jgi:hypothetical protein